MERAQLIKAFTATVQASVHGLQSLQSLLQREQEALVGRDPEALEQLVQEKLALLKQLEYSVQARDRLQTAAGMPAGIDGGRQLVDSLAQEPLLADWAQLTELAKSVAEINDHNGQLALQGQRNARSALEILTGRPRHEDTYSTIRRKHAAGASYSLGKV